MVISWFNGKEGDEKKTMLNGKQTYLALVMKNV